MKFKHYSFDKEIINGVEFERIPMRDADILIKRRKELQMTQQQVADAAGILLRQYQRVESGERNLSAGSARIMLSVCEALQLDPYLFFGKGNEDTEDKPLHAQYLILPEVENNGINYLIPQYAFFQLICAIPYGMVCTDDEIWTTLRRTYNLERADVSTNLNAVDLHSYERFPYWRVISQRGYLIDTIYSSKENQKKHLEKEGHNIQKIGENESYRVMDYKDTHFDINKLIITVMKGNKQILSSYKELNLI